MVVPEVTLLLTMKLMISLQSKFSVTVVGITRRTNVLPKAQTVPNVKRKIKGPGNGDQEENTRPNMNSSPTPIFLVHIQWKTG